MRTLGAPFRAAIGDGSVAATDLATKRIRVMVNSTRSAKSAVTFTDTAISATFTLRNKSTCCPLTSQLSVAAGSAVARGGPY